MPQDAPPNRVIDLPAGSAASDIRPRLVPFVGPRIRSTTLHINMRALHVCLTVSAFGLGMLNSTMRTEALADLTHWFTASIMVLCAVTLAVVTEQPKTDYRRYRCAILVLLASSALEVAGNDSVVSVLATIHDHASVAVLSAGLIVAAICVLEARWAGAVAFAPAVLLYLGGTIACVVIGEHDYERPTMDLVRTFATMSRMLGPVLALRALLRVLSPPEQPAAVRFLIIPHGTSPFPDDRHPGQKFP